MEKSEVIAKYALKEGDTGSPEVQIALLTERVYNEVSNRKNLQLNKVLRSIYAVKEKKAQKITPFRFPFTIINLSERTKFSKI